MSWALALRSDFTPRSDITITVKASTMQCLSGSQPMQARITQRSNKPCRAVRVHSAKADTSICSCSRREILSAALIPANVALLHQLPARAEGASAVEESAVVEAATPAAQVASNASAALNPSHKQVYLDVKVEGESVGRIVVELADDVKVGAQRFADLAEGKQGVGYRLSKFDGIFNTYIRNEGVKSLSYSADGNSEIAGGDSVQALEDEFAASSRRHDQSGLVSLVVKEATERPVKERLVAMGGKLVTLKEQAGEAPNGTAFMITTGPTPELDKTNLVVGKVVGGFDVVQAVASLPFAKPRDSYYDKPFFEAGKMLGDKRATVAEKRFNRPLKRVLVASAGVL